MTPSEPAPRILVAEDEAIVAEDIRSQLDGMGYQVVANVSRGDDAVDLSDRLRPDLILMDIHLKGDVDGITAAERIHRQYGLPVVYLTAYADEATVRRVRTTEAYGYILKPFEVRELRTTIEMALYKHGAESRLRASEERFRALVEGSPTAIIVIARDGCIAMMNAEAERLFGYARDAIIGQPVETLLPRDKVPLDELHRIRLGAGFELWGVRSDGSEIPIELACMPIASNEGALRVLSIIDIAERKRLEESSRLSQGRLEKLIDTITGVVWEADPSTFDFTFVSLQAEQLLGVPRQEWVQTAGFWAAHVFPDDLESARRCRVEAAAAAQPVKFEYRMIAADGRLVWVRDTVSVIRTRDDVALICGVMLDISEERRLAQELAEMNQRLVDASRRAGMADVARRVLHSAGNMLNSINVLTNLLRERLDDSKVAGFIKVAQLLEEHRPRIEAFLTADPRGKLIPDYLIELSAHVASEQAEQRREIEELSGGIEQLKAILTRQESDARVMGSPRAVVLARLVEEALRHELVGLRRRGVEVHRAFEPVPEVTVDEPKVLEVLVELIRNVRHAFAACDRADKRLVLSLRQPEPGWVEISVADNGVGIPVEDRVQIFSDRSAIDRRGHGCGLHHSANAARELGGSLVLERSEPAQGTTFTVAIPVTSPAAEAAKG